MVKLGQYKVPFGLQELVSSGSQQLVDRTLVSNVYSRGRDTGATVWGVLGNNKFEYRAGIFNGNGLTRSVNDNDKFQNNARVTFQPNGAVPLGTYSGAHQSESDFETRALGKPIFTINAAFEENDLSFVATDLKTNLKSTLFTVDTMFKYRGFSATGAYFWGEREPQEINQKFDTSGWYAQAGFFLSPGEVGDRGPLRRAATRASWSGRTRSPRSAAASTSSTRVTRSRCRPTTARSRPRPRAATARTTSCASRRSSSSSQLTRN